MRLLLAAGMLLAAPGAVFAQDFEIEEATIAEVHAAFLSGELTCVELVQGYLARIEAYDQQGPRLNTIANLNLAALDEAARFDQALADGGLTGPLHCIPVLLKDQVETRDMPTTYGSALFADFVSSRDATIVTRMKDAGALIIAKTNMGEFASRYVGSGFGFIRNPYDPRRNPSGSSGGTGAGVAANLGMIGIGEDTGGSIRGPSAVHALVGLRPTLPLVSRYGMMPANPTTDTMGPMTRTVMDAAILLDAIAGYDPNDPVTAMSAGQVPDSYSDGLSEDGLDGARIGIIRDPMDQALDTDSEGYRQARAIVDAAVEQLRALGAEVVDNVAIPGVDGINAIYSMNPHETEAATNAYLAELDDPPYATLRSILLSGRVTLAGDRAGGLTRQDHPRPRLPGLPAGPRAPAGRLPGHGRPQPGRAGAHHLRPSAVSHRPGRRDQSLPGRRLRARRQPPPQSTDGLARAHGARRLHSGRPAHRHRVPGPPLY